MELMGIAGIIANPSSGKDIRRIVAQGWVVSNQEKIAIVRRLLRGMEAAGVNHVLYMPEPLGIVQVALDGLVDAKIEVEKLAMDVTARQEDSTRAAQLLVEQGAMSIVTLGGDGTNRAVFKGCGSRVPILPISTGTNNVFPEFQEGTTAGLAAGMVASGKVTREDAGWHSKVLLLYRQDEPVDLALVDLAISTDNVIGARAIWDVSRLEELFLTRAQPWSIGLSAIGGMVHPLDAREPAGLRLVFGGAGRTVKAAIGPGLFASVNIQSVQEIGMGVRVPLHFERQATLAFDGERDMAAGPKDELAVELDADGPWVIDVSQATKKGVKLF
jgi:predicted polyphosphate/ATP-dependent NAD kinase